MQDFSFSSKCNLYWQLFMQTPDPLFIFLPDMRLEEVNKQGELFCGLARDELVGKELTNIFCHHSSALEVELKRTLSEKTNRSIPITWFFLDNIKTVEAQFYPLLDEKGQIVRISLRFQEAKHIQPSQFTPTLRYVHNLIFSFVRSDEGQYIFRYIEGKLARDLGYYTKDVAGKTLPQIVDAEYESFLKHFFDTAYFGEVVHYERQFGDRWFHTTLSPVMEGDRVVEVIGTVSEVTEQKRVEQALLDAENLYRSLVEESLVGVYVAYVAQKGFVYVNPRMSQIFGYTQAELQEMGAAKLVVPEERTTVKKHQASRINGDTSSIRYQFRGLRKDNSIIELEVIQRTTQYNGKPAVIGMLVDITERKNAEEMVRKSEMLSVVGQLAAGVAHEIRNPLTSLTGFAQLLRSQFSEKKEYFDIMLSELNRIEYIISEFLVLAKPQQKVHQKKDLVVLLEQIIVIARTHAVMNNVEIISQICDGTPLINCDENELKQVFLNILKNAIEAMPDGGKITVELRREMEDQVLISIADEGCGIPEESISKLGQPFYTTKEQGTGLGLMVSFNIIEKHGGSITVKSEQNQGTIFEIRLPIDTANGLEESKQP